ncbi:hypothetical protein T439DRAFT_353125 [Meredithblackwellia eburnea MCA 4105]
MAHFLIVQSPNLSDLDLPSSSGASLGPEESPLSLVLGQSQHSVLRIRDSQPLDPSESDIGTDLEEDSRPGQLRTLPRSPVRLKSFPQTDSVLTESTPIQVEDVDSYTALELKGFLALGLLNDFMLAFESFMGGKLLKGRYTATVMENEPFREEWEGLRVLIDGPGIILDKVTSAPHLDLAAISILQDQVVLHSYPVSPPPSKRDKTLQFRSGGFDWDAKYNMHRQEWHILNDNDADTRQFHIRLDDSRRMSDEQEFDLHYLLHFFVIGFAVECGAMIRGNWYEDWTYQWVDDNNPHIVIFGPGFLKDGKPTMEPHAHCAGDLSSLLGAALEIFGLSPSLSPSSMSRSN